MEISCKIDMRRMANLFQKLEVIFSSAKTNGGKAMYGFAKDTIMHESNAECPRDTWALVNSGYVNRPIFYADRVAVNIGYGGSEDKKNPKTGLMASEYMVDVHENLLYKHPVGKAKFFEDPVRRNAMRMPVHIAGAIGMKRF